MIKLNASVSLRLGVVGALALGLGFAAGAARAGDDGAAPLWTGIGATLGLANDNPNKDAIIYYREHGRLVVPPKMDLPPPGATAARDGNWPVDEEIARNRQLKAEQSLPNPYGAGRRGGVLPQRLDPNTKVTVSSTAGYGPGGGACLKDGRPIACPDAGAAAPAAQHEVSYNPLTWIGIQKNKTTILGPEPAREDLTDPPKGLRDPVEGVGAKVQTD